MKTRELFRNNNFILLFIGRIITNIGDSFYVVAVMWLVFDLGGSTFYTGLAGFLSIIPIIIQFFAGPFIDRISIKPLLVITQIFQGCIVLLIPILAYFDLLTVTIVLIIAPILSTFNMFVYPAQLAALPKILPKEQLLKGNSLFSFAYQGVEITFNAVAGVLITLIGVYSLYILDAISFAFATLFFLQLSLPKEKRIKQTVSVSLSEKFRQYRMDLKEGTSIIVHNFFSRLLGGAIIVNLVAGATFVVLPAFVVDKGGAHWYGFLLTAQALGSLIGSLIAPYLNLEKYKLGKIFIFAIALSGSLWAFSTFLPHMYLTIIIFGLCWIPLGATNVLIFTVIQRIIPERILGRVFAVVNSLSNIASPVGSLLGGMIGAIIGSQYVILASGLAVLLVAIILMFDPVVRSIPTPNELDESNFSVGTDMNNVI